MAERLAWLVPLLPLLGAAWIGAGRIAGRGSTEAGTARAALWSMVACLLLLLVLDAQALLQGRAPGQVVAGTWLASGQYRVQISFTLDALGLGLATLVALLGLFTLRFSVSYLHRETGFQRFFMAMELFLAGMLLIVSAGNAVLAFAGWELAGFSSYLLIAYAYQRPAAAAGATRAFITNRIGDAGFLLAIVLGFAWTGAVEWPAVLGGATALNGPGAGLLAGGFVLAALAKSAAVPFSPWIGRALEGPTPSSALFYGALMVHAGVYLVLRLEPLLLHTPAVLGLLLALGLATSAYGFMGALVQTDFKSVLMFSTTAHVGLMFTACGLGWFTPVAWYLPAHALWRAYQFLSAPGLMHMVSGPPRPVPRWLARHRGVYLAALLRFWLEPLADWLLVRPVRELARDVESFDSGVVNPLLGLPAQASAVSSLAQWEARKGESYLTVEGRIGQGRGLAGKLMEAVANALYWFEQRLVLHGGGEGLLAVLRRIGAHLQDIELMLSQPRYLLLMILATFAVIL